MDSLEYIISAVYERYIVEIRRYCETHKTCIGCRFFNGVCRLNDFPFNWDSLEVRSNEKEVKPKGENT